MLTHNADWLIESIKYFRNLGFFSEHASLTDLQLELRLQELAKTRHGVIDPNDELADLILLSLDDKRVWWDDTEADVCRENQVYAETLRAWSSISRGAFVPEDIRESWSGEKGPVEVTFRVRGRPVTLRPKYMNDYININILRPINSLVGGTEIQFALHAIFDQTAFVVALTKDERSNLIQHRGWRFAI